MIITLKNQDIIEQELYIHDSYFKDIRYDYYNHKLSVFLDNPFIKKSFKIFFNNLSFIQMQNFDIWGNDDHRVIDWNLIEEKEVVKEFIKMKDVEHKRYTLEMENKINNSIYSCLFVSSGDTLEILCEEIEFIEQELEA